jgi:hypothetical protein
LHVDDDQRGAVHVEVQGERFCVDRGHQTSLLTSTGAGPLNSIATISSAPAVIRGGVATSPPADRREQ